MNFIPCYYISFVSLTNSFIHLFSIINLSKYLLISLEFLEYEI